MILSPQFKESPCFARIKCYYPEQGQPSQDAFIQMVPGNPGPGGQLLGDRETGGCQESMDSTSRIEFPTLLGGGGGL